MCGIAVVAGYELADAEAIDKSLKNMSHRGPDANKIWRSSNQNVILAHSRLSINDLSESGNQPLCNEDNTIWLVCNGEIYNYPALRQYLEKNGHSFRSTSDSEVIIHAYEKWGTDCVNHLFGMFAFVIWDENSHQLFAARDHVGIKPLCYAEVESGIAIASDFSGLLPILLQKPEPDPIGIAYIMTLGYIPAPFSIWKGTKKLEPGHWMIWDRVTGLKIQQYWSPPDLINDRIESEIPFEKLFPEVTKEHLLSDVPVGILLSGGLDSSAIAVALREQNRNIKALNISFPRSKYDEFPIAQSVSNHLNFDLISREIQDTDVDALINETLKIFDEPQGYGALMTMYAVSELASKEFKVVLAGDGGDECFGGYTWYRKTPPLSRVFSPFSSILTGCRRKIGWSSFFRINSLLSTIYSLKSPLFYHAWNVFPRFYPEESEFLLSPTGLKFSDDDYLAPLKKYYSPTLPLIRRLQRVDLMTFCSSSILPKVDRASMAHSLEVRVPFLDKRIIEWGLQKPVESEELKKESSKITIRRFLLGNVPSDVLEHPKQGFSFRAMENYNWEKAMDEIDRSWWVKNEYWNKNWRELVGKNIPNRDGRLFTLLILSRWAEQWLA